MKNVIALSLLLLLVPSVLAAGARPGDLVTPLHIHGGDYFALRYDGLGADGVPKISLVTGKVQRVEIPGCTKPGCADEGEIPCVRWEVVSETVMTNEPLRALLGTPLEVFVHRGDTYDYYFVLVVQSVEGDEIDRQYWGGPLYHE